mmetsp:Transcript_174109/g.558254  ORF Transcript_174109/g.558254 Transcript_174109/m.558254 type:complete len:107 (-) Transcript_174109:152-472(-)
MLALLINMIGAVLMILAKPQMLVTIAAKLLGLAPRFLNYFVAQTSAQLTVEATAAAGQLATEAIHMLGTGPLSPELQHQQALASWMLVGAVLWCSRGCVVYANNHP